MSITDVSHIQTTAAFQGRRPKLLFLACYFPPAHLIASVRTWNIAKYMARIGWEVTVVTPEPELWRYTDQPQRVRTDLAREGIRQILTGHDWAFLAPHDMACSNSGLGWFTGGICRAAARKMGINDHMGWIKAAERACLNLVPEDVDLIFASGPPFPAFTVAQRLSHRLQRPYVLDYRDRWTPVLHLIEALQSGVCRLEAQLLEGAAAVTTTSRSLAFDLDSRYKIGRKVRVVTNGFDPEDLTGVKPHHFDHCAIVYAGVFHPPERVITPVMAALKKLAGKGKSGDWSFHYYGDYDRHVAEEAEKFGVTGRVKLHGRVSRSEVLSAISGANVAVVITSVFENPSLLINAIPGKLYEVIGLGTPILLIAPAESDAESIVEPTGLGRAFRAHDSEGIASFLEQLMSGARVEKKNTDWLRWDSLAEQLDGVLREQLSQSSKSVYAS